MGSHNPYADDYTPTYDGGGSSVDAGSGTGFGASLYGLYTAGRGNLPQIAQTYYDMTWTVHGNTHALESGATAAGHPAAMTKLLDLVTDLHLALARTSRSLRDTGQVLVQIAADYVATDQDAVDAFKDRQRVLGDGDEESDGRPAIPDPPRPGDPLPTVEQGEPTAPELPDWTPPDDAAEVEDPIAEAAEQESAGPGTD
jgi:hypothetical protein